MRPDRALGGRRLADRDAGPRQPRRGLGDRRPERPLDRRSVALALAGWLPLTALGVAFVLAQAAAVALFATLQVAGLRRLRTATTVGDMP